MTRNLAATPGVERLCAAQGIDFPVLLATSRRLLRDLEAIRAAVPPLGEDRPTTPDVERAARLVFDPSQRPRGVPCHWV